MNEKSTSAAQLIEAAARSLTSALGAQGFQALSAEERAALSDGSQWPEMLDDYAARLGVNVDAARAILEGLDDAGRLCGARR